MQADNELNNTKNYTEGSIIWYEGEPWICVHWLPEFTEDQNNHETHCDIKELGTCNNCED